MLRDIPRCLLSADFYINFFWKYILCLGQGRVHVYKRHNFKPFETLSKFLVGSDLSPDCLLVFSEVLLPVVIDDQRDRPFQNRPRVF